MLSGASPSRNRSTANDRSSDESLLMNTSLKTVGVHGIDTVATIRLSKSVVHDVVAPTSVYDVLALVN